MGMYFCGPFSYHTPDGQTVSGFRRGALALHEVTVVRRVPPLLPAHGPLLPGNKLVDGLWCKFRAFRPVAARWVRALIHGLTIPGAGLRSVGKHKPMLLNL